MASDTLPQDKRFLVEKGLLEVLLSAAWHYAHRGQTVYDSFDDVQRSTLVKIMEMTSKSLPKKYSAQKFVGDLVGGRSTHYEREYILKEYLDKSWQLLMARKKNSD